MAGIFKAYDIRGPYPEQLNESIAGKIATAYVNLLDGHNIVIGRDMRLSSPALSKAFIRGAVEAGAEITDVGMVTTPMLYYAIIEGKYDGGVMVTASHLPADINGFKLCQKNAIPLSGANGLPALEKQVMSRLIEKSMPADVGSCQNKDYMNRYIDKLSGFVRNPVPLKIVVDAGNGMSGKEVASLFKKVGTWDMIPMYMEPDGHFPHHVANPLIESTTLDLQERVRRENADIGVAFDGDADRCGFIDENGERISEDLITALIAESYLDKNPGAAILYDLRSSKIVPETISRLGGRALRCRVGHAFIKEEMRKEDAVFAGELSGHYYYRDTGFTDNAVFTMIWMLNFLALKKKPLSVLVKPLRKYCSTGEINMQVEHRAAVFESMENLYSDASIDHLDGLTVEYDNWWFNLRASNTEPVIRLNMEADNSNILDAKKKEVLGVIRNAEPAMCFQV